MGPDQALGTRQSIAFKLNLVTLCNNKPARKRLVCPEKKAGSGTVDGFVLRSTARKGAQNMAPVLMLCDVISCQNAPSESDARSEP